MKNWKKEKMPTHWIIVTLIISIGIAIDASEVEDSDHGKSLHKRSIVSAMINLAQKAGTVINFGSIGLKLACLGVSLSPSNKCSHNELESDNTVNGPITSICEKKELIRNLVLKLNASVHEVLWLEALSEHKERAALYFFEEVVRAEDHLGRISSLLFREAVKSKLIDLRHLPEQTRNDSTHSINIAELAFDAHQVEDQLDTRLSWSSYVAANLLWFAYSSAPIGLHKSNPNVGVMVAKNGLKPWDVALSMVTGDSFFIRHVEKMPKFALSRTDDGALKLELASGNELGAKYHKWKFSELSKFLELFSAERARGLVPQLLRGFNKLNEQRQFRLLTAIENSGGLEAFDDYLKHKNLSKLMKNAKGQPKESLSRVSIKAKNDAIPSILKSIGNVYLKSVDNLDIFRGSAQEKRKLALNEGIASTKLGQYAPVRPELATKYNLFSSRLSSIDKSKPMWTKVKAPLMTSFGVVFSIASATACLLQIKETVNDYRSTHNNLDAAIEGLQMKIREVDELHAFYEQKLLNITQELESNIWQEVKYLKDLVEGKSSAWSSAPSSDCADQLSQLQQTEEIIADEDGFAIVASSDNDTCSLANEINDDILTQMEQLRINGSQYLSMIPANTMHALILRKFDSLASFFPSEEELSFAARANSSEPLMDLMTKITNGCEAMYDLEQKMSSVATQAENVEKVINGVRTQMPMEILLALTSNGWYSFEILQTIALNFPNITSFDGAYPVQCVRDGLISSQEDLDEFMKNELSSSFKNSLKMAVYFDAMDIADAMSMIKMSNINDALAQDMDEEQFLRYLAVANPELTSVKFKGIEYHLDDLEKIRTKCNPVANEQ